MSAEPKTYIEAPGDGGAPSEEADISFARRLSNTMVEVLGGPQVGPKMFVEDVDPTNKVKVRRGSLVEAAVIRSGIEEAGTGERVNWGSKLEFILALVGYAVGLGNVWRFPYLCYTNGGGAFLIPYFTMLFLMGIPIFLLELGVGQHYQSSVIHVWKQIHPKLFRGLGWASVITSAIVGVYYNIIICWTLYFVILTFQTPLPWSESAMASSADGPDMGAGDYSRMFWYENALNKSESIDDTGGVVGHLAIALVVSWIFIFFAVCKGVESSGKVVYFTATFPYVVLVILFFKGLTLPGAMDGIRFYLKPDFTKLFEFKVWVSATIQIFYSLGVGWGGLVTYGSYNKKNNDFVRDATLVPLVNCLTSFFAGFVAFSIIGYMAHSSGKPIEDVVDQGAGLAFIVYPAALAQFGDGFGASFFAFLFFMMLFCLGVDSQLAMVETVVTAIVDSKMVSWMRKELVSALVCFVSFLFGLLFVTRGGEFWLTLTDSYAALLSLLMVNGLQCLAVSQVLGVGAFYAFTKEMTGRKLNRFYGFAWTYICPTLCFGMAFISIILYDPGCMVSASDGTCAQRWPEWSVAVGWCIALIGFVPLLSFPLDWYVFVVGGGRTKRTRTPSAAANAGILSDPI